MIDKVPDNELTLQLNGHPDMDEYASFVSNSRHLIKSLTSSVIRGHLRSANRVHWYPSRASINGATTITYEAETQNPENFARVEEAFFHVGEALRYGDEIPYSSQVEQYALRLRKVVEGKDDIESLVFMNEDKEAIVRPEVEQSGRAPVISTYDEIQGRIETISSRKGLRFILYDTHFDRAVTCYIDESKGELDLTQFFGKNVRVRGLVTRDPETDRPFKVRDIHQVVPVEPLKYSWRDAEGVIQFTEKSPERYVRSLRDA